MDGKNCMSFGTIKYLKDEALSLLCLRLPLESNQVESYPTLKLRTDVNPETLDGAMRVFGLNKEEIIDSEQLERKYKKMMEDLERRKEKVSLPISLAIDDLISNIKTAYITISKIYKEKNMAQVVRSSSSKNILKSPLEIFEHFQTSFPLVRAELEVFEDTPRMRLYLTNSYVVEITKALETKALERKIKEIFFLIQRNSGVENMERKFCPEICSLPLSDWKTFRRVMYEREGNRCSDLIIGYLETNSQELLQVLSSLELSPDQERENCSEKEYEYFKRAFYKIKQEMGAQQQEPIINKFSREYPIVFKLILDELVDQELKQGLHEGEDFYQTSLRVLKESIHGQSYAVEKMATSLVSQKNQAANKVFLFVGPTGVGKTELAKAVSKVKENRFIMIPMNQYQGSTDVSKLFGSSAGYVGSTDKPHLAKEFERYKPVRIRIEGSKQFYELSNVVILFDEFEKAHSCVKQSLLTLFDEGHCVINYTDGGGVGSNLTIQYNLKSCIIINTSNLYQQQILYAFIDNQPPQEISELFKKLNSVEPLLTSYSPELLGRMVVIPFSPIPKGECYQALIKAKLSNFLINLKSEIRCREIFIEHERQILAFLEDRLYGEGTDVRRVARYFDDIKGIIYQIRRTWGKLETKKIVFSFEERRPIIRLMTYLDIVKAYHDTPVSKLPFP